MPRVGDALVEGEPLMRRAMDALRRFQGAQESSAQPDEVERLRSEAEMLMRELSSFQQQMIAALRREPH